jgi:three-Cys-motif partner protein
VAVPNPPECRDDNGNCTVAVDTDGLPIQCVGEWAQKKKHHYIRHYLVATGPTRRKFNEDGPRAGSTFIDLFAGNGRARVRETGEHIDGSPLIAINGDHERFTDVVLCELNAGNAEALRRRVAGDRRVRVVEGDCNETIVQIIEDEMIPRNGFGIALLDPFAPSALSFETVRRLASFPHIDLIINFPTGSIRRNFKNPEHVTRYMGRRVDMLHGDDVAELIPMYRRQLIDLGFTDDAINMPRITNGSNVTLYHLIFASKNRLGDTIWNSITQNAPNGQRSFLGPGF